MSSVARVLSIAGSDSGGGAGIQADLKTFGALGVYGCTVITALTAQNTLGVQRVYEVSPDFISSQLDSVLSDIKVGAAKTGMLFNSAVIEAVAEKIRQYSLEKLVVDPVMVAKGGDPLLLPESVDTLKTSLAPLAYLITPNIPEATVLSGLEINNTETIHEAARRIHALGCKYVLIKGGHLEGPAIDFLYDGSSFTEFESPRIQTQHTHGTGCTLSAAIAAGLGKGLEAYEAVKQAKEYLTGALIAAEPVGAGISPVAHYYRWWQ